MGRIADQAKRFAFADPVFARTARLTITASRVNHYVLMTNIRSEGCEPVDVAEVRYGVIRWRLT